MLGPLDYILTAAAVATIAFIVFYNRIDRRRLAIDRQFMHLCPLLDAWAACLSEFASRSPLPAAGDCSAAAKRYAAARKPREKAAAAAELYRLFHQTLAAALDSEGLNRLSALEAGVSAAAASYNALARDHERLIGTPPSSVVAAVLRLGPYAALDM